MTKDQRKIKEQVTQITDLTNQVERLKSDLETVRKYKEQNDKELNDINATFDLLDVPRTAKSSYYNLSVNTRLTLFLAQTHGIKVVQLKEGD